MAGVSKTGANGRGTRKTPAAATTATAAAPMAAAEPAGEVESAPAMSETRAEPDAAAIAAAVGADVQPEPSIVAVPGEPLPIVTASPPLASELGAVDVLDNFAAAIAEPALADPLDQAVHPLAAGQTMLAVERSATDVIEEEMVRTSAEDLTADGTLSDPLSPRPRFIVEVVGPQQGRRRAGFQFGPVARRFYDTQLTDEQYKALLGDPLLVVGTQLVTEDDEIGDL